MGIEFSTPEEFSEICTQLDPSGSGFVQFDALYKYFMDEDEPDEMLQDLETQSMSKVITAQKLTQLRFLFDKVMTPKKDTDNQDIQF